MSKAPDLRENPGLPNAIKVAALAGHLVLFVGAGISRLVNLPSWAGLAYSALCDLRKAGLLNYSELEQLKSLDPKKQLSIAELIATENGKILDLRRHLKTDFRGEGVYKYLNNIGCACVTTNYDELLAPRFKPTSDGSTTVATVKRISKKEDFYTDHLNSPGTVIHLHGTISDPASMVVTTRDYLEHYDADEVQLFLGELFDKKTVLFLGYGLEEAEILEHILRRGRVGESRIQRRFTLQGFFLSEGPLYRKLYDYYLRSFGVHLIGFVRDFEDYGQQENIVRSWSEGIEVRPPALADDLDFMEETLGDS